MTEPLTFREYQRWFEDYDRARGWNRILPAHSLAHLTEEVGEIARLVLKLEGYRELPPEERAQAADQLAMEINDAFVFLTQLALAFGIDLEETIRRGQAKAEARYSVEQGRREAERYRQRQAENAVWLQGGTANDRPADEES
ncbi:MAG: hypothetical protein M5U01_36525 [Ardenticatenaceae bacterium]|nr:hypothetical protein [Ardenticatenaceae bacterium]HBY95953.1 hypothetical protein [Chloroflexota bacterium]